MDDLLLLCESRVFLNVKPEVVNSARAQRSRENNWECLILIVFVVEVSNKWRYSLGLSEHHNLNGQV